MTIRSVTGLDHVIVLTENLDVSASQYEWLGFSLTALGLHKHGTSRNRTIVFEDNYLELLFVEPAARADSRFAGHPPGPASIGFETPDSQRVHDELVALGHKVPEVGEGGRPVDLPGHGRYDARFRTQRFPPDVPGLPSLFTCQHLTHNLIYRAEWREHANTARNVTALHLVHANPAELAKGYAHLFGAERIVTTPHGFDLTIGRLTIRAQHPAAFAEAFPGIEVPDRPAGWFAGFSIAVRSLDAARAALAPGLAALAVPKGGFAIQPAAAGGALVHFHA